MNNPVISDNSQSIFEKLKREYDNTEYWDARDIMRAAGYEKWSNFSKSIKKAILSCRTNNEAVEKHFLPAPAKKCWN